MQSSIAVDRTPEVQYVLRIADTCLILGQRLSEWCGHAPVLEEDIAMANMALDLVGQARALLTRAGELGGRGYDEDQLAFLRDERDYFNPSLVELPRGDFAFTVVRNVMVATFMKHLWARLVDSGDSGLAGIAGKAVKEANYHQRHAADWVVRLGDGTAESRRRTLSALETAWRYMPEWFDADAVDDAAATTGLGPRWSDLREPWLQDMQAVLDEATLALPVESAFRSSGKLGRHSEHMGFILTQMQYLQRAYPGGVW
jgi:ring-1,2-phenylacetyl-CoA epoxidase subunit PaaC